MLVGSERAARHLAQDLRSDGGNPCAGAFAFGIARGKTAEKPAPVRVEAHVESAVLARRPHRPATSARCDRTTPPGRPVTGMTILPAACRRASASYAATVSLPSVVNVSSMSVSTTRIERRTSRGMSASGRGREGRVTSRACPGNGRRAPARWASSTGRISCAATGCRPAPRPTRRFAGREPRAR